LRNKRIAAGQRGPDALIVASHAAPRLPSAATQIESADDLALATTLSQFGGLPAEILARPEWLALLRLSSATTCASVAATATVANHRYPARSISAAATATPS
jgi:surfactin synthase thioesterase subunit